MTAGERLRSLAEVSGTAGVLLLLIGNGATTGAALVDYSGLPTATAAIHLMTDVARGNHGGGWEHYVAPRTRKTLKQYKEEYLELSYFEIEEEEAKLEAEIKLAEQNIRFDVDLGLTEVVAKLKEAIRISKMKLTALHWVVNKRKIIDKKVARSKSLDADLVFITAYLMDDDDV